MIQMGNSSFGRTSYKVGNIDLDGSIMCRNIAGPVTGQIEFIWTESTGGTARFALPKSAVGNATYNSRSMLIAGPAPADTDFVKVSYWQTTNNIFHNLLCDTTGFGADLGVQNDLEVEGDIFTDSIKESTSGAGITLGNDTDAGTSNITADQIGLDDDDNSHHLLLSNINTQVADATLSIDTADASRTLTITGNPTIDDWFDQSVKSGSAPTLVGTNFTGIPDGALSESYLKADGTRALTGDWAVGAFDITFADNTHGIFWADGQGIWSSAFNRLTLNAPARIEWQIGGVTRFSAFATSAEFTASGDFYTLSFNTTGTNGQFIWDGVTDYFDFDDDIFISEGENIYFRDTALLITSSVDGQLDIDADAELELTAPIVDINASTGLSLDGANLNSTWTVNSNNKIFFRDSGIFIHSNVDGEMTIEADTKVTIGVAGDITLGDSTERDMFPETDLKINLGTSSSSFNNLYIGGDIFMTDDGGGLTFGEIYVKDNATTTTLNSAAKVQITIFDTDGESNNSTPDHTNDHITITKAGKYLITVSLSVENGAGAAHKIDASIWKNNGATEFNNIHSHRDLSAGTDLGALALSGIVDLSVNDTIEVWLDTDRGSDSVVTVEDITLSLVQIGG